jgi:predicted  nucleic acid-binding Zn-ribbon protein
MCLRVEESYGDEDQNDLMKLINEYKGETAMGKSKIQELFEEVELYKQAIQDAKDALASAEQELDETLDAEFENQ